MPDQPAFQFVPLAVAAHWYMRIETGRFVIHHGDIAAESGRFQKGAFMRRAMQLLWVSV